MNTSTATVTPAVYQKKVGKITYIVKVHFNENTTETLSDKIKRMIRRDIQQI